MNSFQKQESQAGKKNFRLLILTLLNFFILSLVSNIPGVLIPFWQRDFSLDNQLVSLLGFSFFLAYGLTSLPQSIFLNYLSDKKALLFALCLIMGGSLLFAIKPIFALGIVSLFLIGVGITALQIKANLLVRKIELDPSKYSRNLTLAQVAFGFGGVGGGFLISFLINNLELKWSFIYYAFAALSALIAVLTVFTKIPENQSKLLDSQVNSEEVNEPKKACCSLKEYLALAKERTIWLFGLGIFLYVGIEVGIASWLAKFLIEKFSISSTTAAKVVSLYWAAQSIGRFIGGFILSKVSTGKAISAYASLCFLSVLSAILSPNLVLSIVSFGLVGFFTSIIFPSVFSSAVNYFGEEKESRVAGVLCTAILGGAIVQFLIAFGSEVLNSLGQAILIASFCSFAYLAFLGLKISNIMPKKLSR